MRGRAGFVVVYRPHAFLDHPGPFYRRRLGLGLRHRGGRLGAGDSGLARHQCERRHHQRVPLSTTAPNPVEPFHHRMNPQSLPVSFRKQDSWAKCDMLYTMALDRLDRVKLRIGGRRAYRAPQVLVEDLDCDPWRDSQGPWLDVGHRQEASCVGVPDESGLEDYPLLWVAVPGQRSKPGRGPDQGSAAAEPFVFQGLLPLPLSRPVRIRIPGRSARSLECVSSLAKRWMWT